MSAPQGSGVQPAASHGLASSSPPIHVIHCIHAPCPQPGWAHPGLVSGLVSGLRNSAGAKLSGQPAMCLLMHTWPQQASPSACSAFHPSFNMGSPRGLLQGALPDPPMESKCPKHPVALEPLFCHCRSTSAVSRTILKQKGQVRLRVKKINK